jgi:hypothetical protein
MHFDNQIIKNRKSNHIGSVIYGYNCITFEMNTSTSFSDQIRKIITDRVIPIGLTTEQVTKYSKKIVLILFLTGKNYSFDSLDEEHKTSHEFFFFDDSKRLVIQYILDMQCPDELLVKFIRGTSINMSGGDVIKPNIHKGDYLRRRRQDYERLFE